MITLPEPAVSHEPTMCLREKIAWVCLGSTVAIYAIYFLHVFHLFAAGRFRAWNLLGAMMVAAVAQIFPVLGTIPFAWRNLREKKDERDAALELRASRHAYWVLAVSGYSLLVVAAPVWAVCGQTEGQDFWFAPLVLSQAALLGFVLAETVRFGTLALGYRRGI